MLIFCGCVSRESDCRRVVVCRAGKEKTDEMLTSGLPGPVKTLHDQYWATEELATNKFLLESIKLPEKPAAEPSQRCCGPCRWYRLRWMGRAI